MHTEHYYISGINVIALHQLIHQILKKSLSLLVRAAQTKYHKLGGLNNRHFYFLLSGGWKVQDQVVGRLVRALFLACRRPPSLCVLTLGRGRVAERTSFLISSDKETNSIMSAPPKSPTSKYNDMGGRCTVQPIVSSVRWSLSSQVRKLRPHKIW